MAYGGSIKLTGESEYRNAIKNITRDLQGMSSALKSQTADFNSNDKSIKNNAQAQKQLNETIKTQQNELSKAKSKYAEYSVAVQEQTTKHNLLNKEYKNAVTELERIKKVSGESSTEYKNQAEVVDKLGRELVDSTEAMNESKTAMASLKSEINSSQKTINNAEKALNDLGNEAQDSGKKAEKGSDGFTVMKGVIANLASTAITSAINGLKKLGNSLVDVGKQSIANYAEYEQLIGGIESMFGGMEKGAKEINKVQEYSKKAWKDLTLSQNDYYKSFSSTYPLMKNDIEDQNEAIEKTQELMVLNSDLANTFGYSVEEAANAINWALKGTYSYLDNLNLGIKGTKEGFLEAAKSCGYVVDSVDELTSADKLNIIKQYADRYGVLGKTAEEASKTIQGSVKSMQAAWSNLLTAIADDNKDLGKSVNEFVDSTITASKNLVPRVKTVVEGIKKLINSIVKDVFPKLKKEIPELAPIIDVFQWFIKNRQLVVNAIGAMVAAFAVTKIVSFVTAITSLINPIGLVVTGVTALIGVFGILNSKTNTLTEAEEAQAEALRNQTNEINSAKDAWDSLKEAQQNQINTGMTEISHLQSLRDELEDLVDENGKVKDGYEARASFITDTLNNALGTEISMVDGVIQNYDSLKSTLDEVMEKKKAQIILDSQESLYRQAIEGQTEALKRLSDAETMLAQKAEERKALEEELTVAQLKYTEAVSSGSLTRQMAALAEIRTIGEKMSKVDEETANYQSNYNTQQALLEEYAYNVGQYEQNMAYAHAGEYDKMSTVNWEYVKDYQATGDAEKAQLEDQIKTTEKSLEVLRGLKEKSGNDLYDSQIKANEKQLQNLQENLTKYTSTTKKGLDATKVQWTNGLDEILSEITKANIEFKEDGEGNITMYADGIKQGEPKSKEEMAKLVSNTISEVTAKNPEAKEAGEYLIDGVNAGIQNQNKQSGVFNAISSFGSKILSKLKASLQERSPSKATKEMGKFLLEGLGIGIDSEENTILKQVTNFGKSVIGAMNSGLSDAINTSAITDIGNMSNIGITGSRVATSQAENNIDIVEAFKTALSQMKIELDDEVAGEFVEKTVTRVVYN